MPAVARKDDEVLSPTGSGVGCSSPLTIAVDEVNSASVYADNILIVVEGNLVKPHPLPGCTSVDKSVLSTYSPNVFIGNKKVGRKGDMYNDNEIKKGSSDVFANGKG